MLNTKLKWYIKLGIIILSLIFILSVVPYLFPVTKASANIVLPFENSQLKNIEGIDLHYREWLPSGHEIKGKILLVHGFGSSVFCWRNNVDALLDKGYIVLAVDLPGFGHSDRSRGIDHSQENRAYILWKLISEIDSTYDEKTASAKWHLAGHSMGGGTVTAMALADPERTRSLILIDGALFLDTAPAGKILYYPPASRWLEVIIRHQILRKERIEDILGSAYGTHPSDEDLQGYFRALDIGGTEGCLSDMVLTATAIKENEFAKISLPVFAVWGENDTVVPLSEAYGLLKLLPEMSLEVLSGAGHCPMETHSGKFNEFIINTLDAVDNNSHHD